MEHWTPTPGIQWYKFRPPGVTPNRGMGPPWGAFCQITLTSCLTSVRLSITTTTKSLFTGSHRLLSYSFRHLARRYRDVQAVCCLYCSTWEVCQCQECVSTPVNWVYCVDNCHRYSILLHSICPTTSLTSHPTTTTTAPSTLCAPCCLRYPHSGISTYLTSLWPDTYVIY